MTLTAAHFVYLAGLGSLIVVMAMRKTVVVPAVLATLLTATVATGRRMEKDKDIVVPFVVTESARVETDAISRTGSRVSAPLRRSTVIVHCPARSD